jgi:anti-sigma regulatory factor (Ser/Thr protein kinase)
MNHPMASSGASGSNGAGASGTPLEAFRFVMPARLEYRDAARTFLGFVCDQLHHRELFSADVSHQVMSAFVEAFNNTAIHAYRDRPVGPVEVRLDVHRDRLVVTLIDEGSGFEASAVPPPSLDPTNVAALPEGGMGLFIMRSFMDEVTHRAEDGRNVLTLVKRLAHENRRETP